MTAVVGSQPARTSKGRRWIVHSVIVLTVAAVLAAIVLPNMV